MNILINREDILKPLQTVGGIIEKKQTLAVLSNLLIKADGNTLTFVGTDTEIEMVSAIPYEVAEPFEITLPARKLIDICKALPPNSEIKFTTSPNSRVTIQSGRSRFILSTLPVEDFPNIEALKDPTEFSIEQFQLKELLGKTTFAMGLQDVRYYLNGLLLDISENTIKAIATDGHRLAFSEIDCNTNNQSSKIIVPRKGILELARLLEDNDEQIYISISSNHIQIKTKSMSFTSKLIDGNYPDYNRVIPSDSDKEVVVNRENLKQALARTSILSNEKYRGVCLIFSDNLLQIDTHNPEQEEAEEEIEIIYSGENLKIGFNVTYLLETISILTTESIHLLLKDSDSSCLIKGEGDHNSKYVVMPMHI
ncbi:MAG: DNA polymerase III subunit beta [Gammaproteobacteria bacterium]|nr:DNA polymerase III subunit beta [Gammaproteobacteria bacterium]